MTYYNYLGQPMPESASPINSVYGTPAGYETLTAPTGPSGVDSGGGTGDLLIGSSGDNTFYVKDPSDIVQVASGLPGVKSVVAFTSFTLPANVQNLASSGAFNYAAGNSLDNLIVVGNDAETLYGGPGNDVLVGGDGADTFIVKAGEGNDVIYNWHAGDLLQLGGVAFKSFADVRAAMTQKGNDVVLQIDPTETLTFRNATPASFQASQFLLPLDRSKLGPQTFNDDFNTLQLYNFSTNTGQWQASFGFDPHNPNNYSLLGNGEQQMYTSADFQGTANHPLGLNPFSVSNGVLSITAQPIPASEQSFTYGGTYSSGLLDTRGIFEQKFGYFEIRMAIPTTATGAWPAFWMAPDPNLGGVEADITENNALQPNIDFVRGFGGSGNSSAFANVLKTGDITGFHTYGLMWTPQTVTLYYDDQAVYQAPTPSTWTNPMYLIANMAIGGFGGTPDPSKFPASMQIDYIRAYGLPDGSTIVKNLTPLAPGGTLRVVGGVTSGQPTLAVQTFDSDHTAVTTRAVVQISTDPLHASPAELSAAGAKALLIWDSGGGVFAAYKDGTTYSLATQVAVGTVEDLHMTGSFLSDGKALLTYIQTDNGVQHAWATIVDPGHMTIASQQLGNATGGITVVATAHGGFAASWHNGSEIDARGYDGFGYYGSVVTTQGDLAGLNSAGDAVVSWKDATGQHSQLYDVLLDPFNPHNGASPPPPPPPPPPPTDGTSIVLTATTMPATLTGGNGNDTLNASTGPDLLTGGAGADVFVWANEPWAPAHVTDFVPGTDKLDLSALLKQAGYTGSDPVADHYIVLQSDGTGGTKVLFDPDGPGSAHPWPDYIINLDHTLVSSWAQLIGQAPADNPGVVLTAKTTPATLTGGAGDDTLNASQGADLLTGGAGADVFAWAKEPWAPAHITDFAVGTDRLDLSALFKSVGYTGSDPVADRYIVLQSDGAGGTKVLFDPEGPGAAHPWPDYIINLDHTVATTWAQLAGAASGDPPGVTLTAPPGGGLVQGGAGADTIIGAAEGNSRLLGGGGDDVLYVYGGNNTVNGNMGADTIHSDAGNSWLSGGKDNDLIYANGGNNTVNGNLGNDTIHGGDAGNYLRGGQGDDVIIGGAGNDNIWGDRGNNTVTGGGGADTFHTYGASGVMVVTDFHFSEGDRVHIDDGATYTAVQQGADVVINLVGGGQVILQNAQLTSLGDGWIT